MPMALGAQQTLSAGAVQSPVLVIQPERLFDETLYGKRLAAEIDTLGSTIAAENRKIEAELIEEERVLTEQRASMPAEAFRPLAAAFDEKVQTLRQQQDAKARALGTQTDDAQRKFSTQIQPILREIMQATRAAVIMDKRTVFASIDAIDITEEVIERLDATIGDGSSLDQ